MYVLLLNLALACGQRSISLRPGEDFTLASPNAPSTHPPGMVCLWLLVAPRGTRVGVRVLQLHLAADTWVTVGEGAAPGTGRRLWQRRGGTAPVQALAGQHRAWVTAEDTTVSTATSKARFTLQLSVFEDAGNTTLKQNLSHARLFEDLRSVLFKLQYFSQKFLQENKTATLHSLNLLTLPGRSLIHSAK